MRPDSDGLVVPVTTLYEDTADSYSAMMDEEIRAPAYADTLDRLHERLVDAPGALIDTSCGSGHMLSLYAERHGRRRELVGIDLTPRMVAMAEARLGSSAVVSVGDMRRLSTVADGAAAAVLSYFALHHLALADVGATVREWHRALRPGGQLVLAAWEGAGTIDYGEESDVVAFEHRSDDLSASIVAAGFSVDRCEVETVEDMGMDAVYLEATRV